MKLNYVIFIITLVFYRVESDTRKLPTYVKTCRRADPKISECWVKTYYEMVPHLANGIPEMGLAPLDPRLVDKISLDMRNSSAVSFHAELRNVSLVGLKELKFNSFLIDIQKLEYSLDMSQANLYLSSNYRATGKVMMLEIDSVGHFNVNLTNLRLKSYANGTLFIKDGMEYIKWTIQSMDVTFEKVEVYFENLFPKKELNAAANEAFNANVDILYDEIKPIIGETVKKMFANAIDTVCGLFPLDVLYPK